MKNSVSVPTIYNLTLTNANTEYSQALNAFPAYITIQCRSVADLKVAFTSGQSGTTYITIPAGSSYTFPMQIAGVKTVYVQSPSASAVVEILEWR